MTSHTHPQTDPALTRAMVERICSDKGLTLTPTRGRVLGYLLEADRAIGAYAVLDRLRADGMAAQPPVAYRALDFLVRNGFAHKIEGMNAFVACAHPGHSHTPVFLICRACHAVAEADASQDTGAIGRAAGIAGFRAERYVREAVGLCRDCAAGAT